MSKMYLLYFQFFFCFCASNIRKPVPVPFEIISLQFYNDRCEKQSQDEVLVFFLTNTSGNSDDISDLFYDGAELAASFVGQNLSFGIVYDSSIKSNRVVCSYPGIPKQSFKLNDRMIPPEVATKILHLAARTLKQARRSEKEKKNPFISKIKAELRANHKLLKRTSNEDSRRELIEARQRLISQYLKSIPEYKRESKRIKLAIKGIIDKNERKEANKIVHEMKATRNSNKQKAPFIEAKKHHKYMKKLIDKLRESWKLSHQEESKYNRDEILQRISIKRKEKEEQMLEDSSEMQQVFKMFKNMRTIMDSDDVDQFINADENNKANQDKAQRNLKKSSVKKEFDVSLKTDSIDQTSHGLDENLSKQNEKKNELGEGQQKDGSNDNQAAENNIRRDNDL